MPTNFNSTPTRQIQPQVSLEQSDWVSAWHPVVFGGARVDASVYHYYDYDGSGGGVVLELTEFGNGFEGGDFSDELEVGQEIWIDTSHYSGYFTITDVSTALVEIVEGEDPVLVTVVRINAAEEGWDSFGGSANFTGARTSYLIEIDVQTVNADDELESISDSYYQCRPDNTFSVTADLQAWLQSIVSPLIDISYNTLNDVHQELGRQYTFRYREYWREAGYGEWTQYSPTLAARNFVTNSVARVGDKYGQNRAEDLPFAPFLQPVPSNGVYNFVLVMKPEYGGASANVFIQDGPGVEVDHSALIHIDSNGTGGIVWDDGMVQNNIISNLSITTTMGDTQSLLDAALAAATIEPGWEVTLTTSGGFGPDYFRIAITRSDYSSAYNGTTLAYIGSVFSSGNTYTLDGGAVGTEQDLVFSNGDDEIAIISGYPWTQDINGDGMLDFFDTIEAIGGSLQTALQANIDSTLGGGEATIALSNARFEDSYMKIDVQITTPLSSTYLGYTIQPGAIINTDAVGIEDYIDNSVYEYELGADTWHKGNFLTMFERPKYFAGYPFALFFMYNNKINRWFSSNIPTDTLRLHKIERQLDVNETELAITKKNIAHYPGFTNSLLLQSTDDEEEYADNVKSVAVSLYSHYRFDQDMDGQLSSSELGEMMDDEEENDLTGDGEITEADITIATAITELMNVEIVNEKIIDIDSECVDNGIYLRWLNPKGGQDYWLFKRVNDVRDTVEGEETFEEYIEDLADALSRKEAIKKEATEEISLGADLLTIQQAEGLRYLLRSIKVEMYIGVDDDENPIWHTVRLRTGRFPIYNKPENKASIEITIILPQPFNQQQ